MEERFAGKAKNALGYVGLPFRCHNGRTPLECYTCFCYHSELWSDETIDDTFPP